MAGGWGLVVAGGEACTVLSDCVLLIPAVQLKIEYKYKQEVDEKINYPPRVCLKTMCVSVCVLVVVAS